MKRIVGVICVVLMASVGVSLAAGATAPGNAWLVPKAERMLKSKVEVGLPVAEKALLEAELRKSVALFNGLQMWALDAGDENAWWTYGAYANRYEHALRVVDSGLRIEVANCAGSGRSLQPGRYGRFHCLATSEALSIPSATLEYSAGSALPTVIEGEARIVGPYFTQLKVRVTGKATFAYE